MQEGYRGMCSDTLDPGGEVRGCSIAMSDVSPFVWVKLARPYREFPQIKCFLMWVCVGCGGIISCSDWHRIFLLFPLHIAYNFESYAAHRTPPLSAVCCKKQHKEKTPHAQHCTSSLLIPCAYRKLKVKHHRTTPKPEIHTYHSREKAEAALARK